MSKSYTLGLHRGAYVAVHKDASGKRIRRSLGTSNKAEAERRLAHIELTTSVLDRDTQKTVEDLFNLYCYDKELENKSTNRIRTSWKELSKTFGHLYPQYVTPELVKSYCQSRKVQPGTLHFEVNVLRTLFSWAYKNKHLSERIHIKLPPKPPPKTAYLTRNQFQIILDATKQPHLRLFMILAITTGARSNAILDLTWDRVDLDKRIIDLRNTQKSLSNKGRAIVPVNDTAFRYLTEAKQGAQTHHVIEYAGLPVRNIRYALYYLSERTGLKVTAHMFRHSAAVWMAEGGVRMEEIAQYLGHTNSRITEQVYARFSPTYLRKAASHLEI